MDKIVIVYDESEEPKAWIATLAELFPECEIIAVSKYTKTFGVDGGNAPSKKISQTKDIKGRHGIKFQDYRTSKR
jgi:hypothetical protein